MASVLSVANYILQNPGPMTAMKLQKLVYYSQAWSLVWDGKPLFEEEIQAWANGPVCPKLFKKHRGEFTQSKDRFQEYGMDFISAEKETMDAVIEGYNEYPPYELSELTHSEFPWKKARKDTPAGLSSSSVISLESMQEFYSELAYGE